MKNKTRKLFLLTLLTVFALSLVGCGKKAERANKDTGTETSTAEITTEEVTTEEVTTEAQIDADGFTVVNDTVKTTDYVNVRTSPDTEGTPAMQIATDTELTRTGYNDEWSRVKVQGNTYYVYSEYVVKVGYDDSSSTDATGDSEDTKDQETPSETPAEEEKNTSDNKDGKSDEVNSAKANKDNTDKENKDENSKKENDTQNDKDKNSKENSTDKSSDSADVTGKLEIADDTTQDTADEKKNDSDNTDSKDDNIFDNPVLPDEKDNRPTDVEDNLSDEEKEERAEINHTCDGITVSGANLPWYVQFRVSSGDSYQFTNESDAMIFQSYEFELWDLQNDTEYEIPSGEYVSVTVPVKSGYEYTIEHLLDNGATETIIPSVEDGIMVFSTHSFSPFGIAGSRQLVGPDTGDDSNSAGTVTPTPASSDTQEQSSDTGKNNTVSINTNSDNNNTSSLSAQTDS